MGGLGRGTLQETNEIQYVEFPSRVGKQPRQVPHAGHISQVRDVPLEGHGPVIPFTAEDILSLARIARHGRRRPLAYRVRRATGLELGPDTLECRVSRSELEDGVRVVALGTIRVGQSHPSECGLVGRANLAPLM